MREIRYLVSRGGGLVQPITQRVNKGEHFSMLKLMMKNMKLACGVAFGKTQAR